MHDVYNIQHPADFCPTFDRLALHLGGVCWALEHGGQERGYRALQQFIERQPFSQEVYPPAAMPVSRGTITIANLATAAEPPLLIAGVDRWARAVWVAYAPLHAEARTWLQRATTGLTTARR
jgi:hypothetical protein